MYKIAKPMFLRTITPLHVGSGQDLGIVDMPIQRERHTSYPKVEASSLKGAIRSVFDENKAQTELDENMRLFGSNDNGGCLGFTDCRLLAFPVKSVKGLFAMITCPRVLHKFSEELTLCNLDHTFDFDIDDGSCRVANKNHIGLRNCVIIEEYALDIHENVICKEKVEELVKLTGCKQLNKNLVIVSDNTFRDFVNLSTEVITRTKIDPRTGTVINGALFTEEYLPSESILYTLVFCSPEFTKEKNGMNENEVLKKFEVGMKNVFQLGGNSSLGKGIVLVNKEHLNNENKDSQ